MTETTTDTTATTDRKLDRIRRLIEMASRETKTPGEEAERKHAQEQAERLMLKYSVEEWQLKQAGGRKAADVKPTKKDKILICQVGHPCRMSLASLAIGIGRHLNVSVVFSMLNVSKPIPGFDVTATAIGYPDDLRMWEMIFTMLHLQLIGKIDPQVDPTLTFDENVYTLHSAGIKWPDIARKINAAKTPDEWYVKWSEHGDGGRLKRAARRHAAKIGQPYVTKANPVAYQRSFTEGFVLTVLRRFADARDKEKTTGMELVLRDKFASVLEYQGELYPELGVAVDKSKTKFDANAYANGKAAGEQADLNLTPKATSRTQGALE